jgi:3-deoxy-7-phosphoheptulonate synthase
MWAVVFLAVNPHFQPMIINIQPNTSQGVVSKIANILGRAGVRYRFTQFGGHSVFVAENIPQKTVNVLLKRPEIGSIADIPNPYPLCSLQIRPERSTIRVRDFVVGPGNFTYIAGPCTVETEEQVLTTARHVKAAGATALRGGAFKPRTSPYAFQGMKLEGLKILQKVGKKIGLVTVTEAMSPEEVKVVAEYADVVQIGTRNAQNYRLLEACGEARVPILLKRGFSCTLEEFLMSAEYILAGGNEQVILCERGIRTFETHVRYTLPVGTISSLKLLSHLPVIVDPSHAAGRADLVPSLAFASTAAGADGLLVEVHPDPAHALCDGRQSLTPDEFVKMVRTCEKIRKVI